MSSDGTRYGSGSNPSGTLRLSHVAGDGTARMVDVGLKPMTRRLAVAQGVCVMQFSTGETIRANTVAKGDVLAVARLAGVMAAKRTDELIPLCHSVPLDQVDVEFTWEDPRRLLVTASASCTGRTGVEMEAMVAVSVACLTVYDMCKSLDRELYVERVELIRKSGGKSGEFVRSPTP